MTFNLLQLDINVFAPAVNYDPSLLARIAKVVEHLQSAFGGPDTRNIESQDEQDVVGHVEGGDGDRIERMRQINHDALISLAYLMKDFRNVLGLYFFCFVRFGRCCEQ